MIPNLRKKLQAMSSAIISQKPDSDQGSANEQASRDEAYKECPGENNDLGSFFGGVVYESCHGRHIIKKTVYPLAAKYGSIPLDGLKNLQESSCKIWTRIDDLFSIEDLVFLDTETTGLAGGTGTIAFLIGLGYVCNDDFIIEQHIMRDFDEELSMLHSIMDILKDHSILVTFNGKSFDWPLLEARYIASRIRPIRYNGRHIDLLHISRRLWKQKYSSCSLTALERKVLDKHRLGDIPGSLIPSIYYNYLETKNETDMMKVIEHNEQDIVAMAALFTYIDKLYKDPVSKIGDYELFGKAVDFELQKKYHEAISHYGECIHRAGDSNLMEEARKRAALLLKRHNRHDEAAAYWVELSNNGSIHIIHANIELAKYFEHKKRDYESALMYTERALRITIQNNCSSMLKVIEEIEHRKQRLNTKLKKERKI